MHWRVVLLSLIWLLPCPGFADIAAGLTTPNQLCRQAIAVAERAHGIPSHLLAAIARVESGRREPATDRVNPWPWTINMDGQGSFFDDKTQAVAAARMLRPRVTRSIDVGCMQISLTQHPDAFVSLEQAFDPMANADYGARFLLQLFEKTGSWPQAVGFYHSQTPDLAQDYQRKVFAALPAEKGITGADGVPSLAAAWAATVVHSPLGGTMRPIAPRMMALQPALTGPAYPGRTLASYRAESVRFAYRALQSPPVSANVTLRAGPPGYAGYSQ